MRLGRYLWVFAFLTFAGNVYATDYYWRYGNNTTNYPSAQAACEGLKASFGPGSWVTSVKPNSALTGCIGSGDGQPDSFIGAINRYGTTCPSGTEYNSAAGSCDAPPGPVECEQTWTGGEMVYSESQGQCVKYPNLSPEEYCAWSAGKSTGFSKISAVSGDASGPSHVADPGTFCGIEVTKAECKMNTAGIYDCVVSGTYTGEYDPTATKSPGHCSTQDCETVPPEDPIPEPEVIKVDTPCVYSSSGDKQVCSSTKSEEQEGTAQCGFVNGVQTCITKQPSKNGIDITTELTKQMLEDGSTITTKKDTATVTSCKGVKNCTTSTATTTTITKKDGNGNTTLTDSKCTGSACGSSSNPDGDGDGVGDCFSGDCGGGAVEGQDWYTPTDDTFGAVLTEFVRKVQQTPIASQTTSFLTFRASGSCPRWSVSVWVFDIDIDQLCSGDIPWGAIKAVIVAAAGFFAFRIALL